MNTIHKVGADYGYEFVDLCGTVECSVGSYGMAMAQTADLLPNCDVKGLSRRLLIDGASWYNNSSSYASSSSSSRNKCVPVEKAVFKMVFDAYEDEFINSCANFARVCPISCESIARSLRNGFPDCYYPEYDSNYADFIASA